MGERTRNAEIAFFGGSFTAIDRDYMLELLTVADECVKKYGFIGVRCSTRPDKIDEEVLKILKEHSVTSIELGAQSMSDRILFMNDRGHDAQSVRDASALIKSFTYKEDQPFELGLQMMTGLYGSTAEDDIFTAQEIIKLKPKTVRIYPTITLENTRLADLYRSGEYVPPTLEETVKLVSKLISMFEENSINVIRVGLHASEEISDKRIAGPYHPAFKELCMSEILFNEILKALELREKISDEIIIKCSPKLLSACIGQKKGNIERLNSLGYKVRFTPDKETERFSLL